MATADAALANGRRCFGPGDEMVRQDLTSGFPVINLLSHYCGVDWREMPNAGGAFNVEGVAGLRFEAVPLPSKAPPYSPHRHDPHLGDNIGISIVNETTGKRPFYAPGLGEIELPTPSRGAESRGNGGHDDGVTRTGIQKP